MSSAQHAALFGPDEAKYKDCKQIVITDFDGTITLLDSNDHMVDTVGMGE